jgi:hypothetical protein
MQCNTRESTAGWNMELEKRREEKRALWFAAGGSAARIRPNVLGLGEWAEGRCEWPVDGLWMRICYSNFGAALKEAVLAGAADADANADADADAAAVLGP